MRVSSALVACAWTAGCAPDAARRGREVTWEDVAPVVERCVACHDHAGLTIPLTTWSEVAPVSAVVAEVTRSGRMPPWPAGPAGVAYLDDPTLTAEEIDLLVAWDEAGAPLGRGEDPDRELVPPKVPHLPRTDVTLSMPEPYLPAAGADEYRCFALDRAAVTDRFVTGVEGIPGERAEVHHLLLHGVVPREPAQSPALLDAADPAPGFSCPERLEGDVTVFGGWLPGRGPTLLPDGLGFELADEAELVMELHYYGPVSGSVPDLSSIALMTEPAVVAAAGLVAVRSAELTNGVAVPAGGSAAYSETLPADEFLVEPGGSLAWAVVGHMHTHGTTISLDRLRDGESLRLLDIPAWDFDWQLQYRFADAVELLPTDELVLSCAYENPGATAVVWGDTTGEEMCLARLMLSPSSADPRTR